MSTEPDNPPDRVHLHLYLEYPLTVNIHHYHTSVQEPGKAVSAIMTIGGQIVGTSAPATPPQVTVDEQNKSLGLKWVDDRGDTDAAAPPNAQVAYDGDNPAVATVDAQTGKITPVAEGMFNGSVSVTDSSTGQPFEFNGTALALSPIAINVVAGAATGAELEIETAS